MAFGIYSHFLGYKIYDARLDLIRFVTFRTQYLYENYKFEGIVWKITAW